MPRARKQAFSAPTRRLLSAMRRKVSDFDTSYAALARRQSLEQRGARLTERRVDETGIRDGAVRGGAQRQSAGGGSPESNPTAGRNPRAFGSAGGDAMARDRRRAASRRCAGAGAHHHADG